MAVGLQPVTNLLRLAILLATASPSDAAQSDAEGDAGRLAAEDSAVFKSLTDPLLADGFDFPVGNPDGQGSYRAGGKTFNGWYQAVKFCENYEFGIHTGEDWNGRGGGDTDLGQAVRSIATGRVIRVTSAAPYGNIVVIEHHYLENGQAKVVFSQYDHLDTIDVLEGAEVKRREKIGTIGKGDGGRFPAHLHLEIRKETMRDKSPTFWPSSNNWDEKEVRANYEPPSEFIRARRKLLHPASAPNFILVIKHRAQLHRFQRGRLAATHEAAISQNPIGPKTSDGDLKTPEGEYRVIQKAEGPFGEAEWMKFLGTAWLRLNYPNEADARAALAAGSITRKQLDAVLSAHRAGRMPPGNTPLGGGIGIHGWAEGGWKTDANRHLTWGCVSLNHDDLTALYQATPPGTPVVILP